MRDRVLLEFRLFKEGDDLNRSNGDDNEEPLRAFIHGPPGTGKSAVIQWVRHFFTEALGWEHGVEFMCVAFQNRVAHAMGGSTMHTAGDIRIGSVALDQNDSLLLHMKKQQW